MKCEEAKQALVDAAAGNVTPELQSHLESCAECRADSERVMQMWQRLGAWEDVDPRPAVKARFSEALEAYEEGLHERQQRRWFFWRPAFQIALSFGCLLVGLVCGQYLASSRSDVAELRAEMTNMRQLVTLSLLQQQSAAERLRGVGWANQVGPNDMEVLSALLRTVNTDNNENVRLAAIDALRNFGNSPVARRGLVQALSRQTSPLVQIAIIDLLTDLKESGVKDELQQMLQSPELDPFVKTRITRSLTLLP